MRILLITPENRFIKAFRKGEADEVLLVMGQGHPDNGGNDPDGGPGEEDGEPEGDREFHAVFPLFF
jgi:hypothetical protein